MANERALMGENIYQYDRILNILCTYQKIALHFPVEFIHLHTYKNGQM